MVQPIFEVNPTPAQQIQQNLREIAKNIIYIPGGRAPSTPESVSPEDRGMLDERAKRYEEFQLLVDTLGDGRILTPDTFNRHTEIILWLITRTYTYIPKRNWIPMSEAPDLEIPTTITLGAAPSPHSLANYFDRGTFLQSTYYTPVFADYRLKVLKVFWGNKNRLTEKTDQYGMTSLLFTEGGILHMINKFAQTIGSVRTFTLERDGYLSLVEQTKRLLGPYNIDLIETATGVYFALAQDHEDLIAKIASIQNKSSEYVITLQESQLGRMQIRVASRSGIGFNFDVVMLGQAPEQRVAVVATNEGMIYCEALIMALTGEELSEVGTA